MTGRQKAGGVAMGVGLFFEYFGLIVWIWAEWRHFDFQGHVVSLVVQVPIWFWLVLGGTVCYLIGKWLSKERKPYCDCE